MEDSPDEFLEKFNRASKAEVAQLVKDNLGYWPSAGLSKDDAVKALSFNLKNPPTNTVDVLRREIVTYIQANKDRLSMKCDGDCFSHPDGVVVACHLLLKRELEKHKEDANAETSTEDV